MTLYEFFIPVIGLAVAGVGVLLLRREAHKLDDQQHPAE